MFSSGGAFGSGGGASNNTNSGSGFGGFGQSAQNKPTGFGGGSGGFGASTTTGAGGFGSGAGIGGFGSTSTGGGGFGGTSGTFGGGGGSSTGAGGFGSSAGGGGFGSGATAGAFGQQPAAGGASSLFGGGGGGAFGAPSAAGGGGFGVGATGTARAAFEPVIEHSTTGKKDNFRHICFMNAYKAFSPEELRLEDYEAGRKKADAPGATAAAAGARGGFGAQTGFGGSTAGGGAFGQPQQAAGGFGQTAGGFGQSTGGFGQPAGGFGQQPASASVAGGFGLSKPAAAPATTGFGGGFSSGSGIGGFGQAPAAAGMFGAAKPSAFGQPAAGAFGSTAAGGGGAFGSTGAGGFGGTSTGGAFGSTGTGAGAFGQTAAPSTGGGLFGQTNATAGGFGSQAGATGGAFGAKPAFGQTAFGGSTAAQPATTGGGFGQATGSTGFGQTTGGFGQTAGGFGQTASTGGGGLFGQTNTAAPAAGGGLFGQTVSAAGGGGGGLFGAKPAAPATGGGLFGMGAASSAAPATGGLFGQTAAAPATGGGGLFGQPAAPATGGGLFGNTGGATTGGGLFGAKPAVSAATGGGGLFGSAPAAGAQAGAGTTGGGLFGTGAASGGGGGLFGSAQTGTGGATGGGGLFGNTAAGTGTGTGLFGSTAGAGGGLFGGASAGAACTAAPGTTTGLFGFGQASQQQQQQQPAQLQSTMFGAAQPVQQQLAAQIDRQPYGANALFDTTRLAGARALAGAGGGTSSHLTATPLRAVPAPSQHPGGLDSERDLQQLKKRGLSLHSLLASSPHVGSTISGAAGRPRHNRGFAAAPATTATTKKLLSEHVGGTSSGSGGGVGLFGRDGFLSPEAQLPHSNVKRLVITRKPSFGANARSATPVPASSSSSAAKPLTSFGEMLGSPPRMKNPWADSPLKSSSKSMAGRTPAASRHFAASVAAELEAADEEDQSAFVQPPTQEEEGYEGDENVVEEEEEEEEGSEVGDVDEDESGGYWMRPALADLRAMTTHQLRAVKNFTVGRTGVGQVSFCRPVDLTTIGSLAAIAGGVVLFDDRVCTVYPDESNKPARGLGLNVPATISLHNCWPVERSTAAPIEHMDDPRVRKHIKRLRRIEETEFIDFVNGTWIFRVEHFSRYGLDDNQASSDDDDDDGDGDGGGGIVDGSTASSSSLTQGFGNATAQQAPKAAQQSQLDNGSRAVADVPTRPLFTTTSAQSNEPIQLQLQQQQQSPQQQQQQQRPPPHQILLGARHAESLRRGPVMRASLFATNDSSQQQAPAVAETAAKPSSSSTSSFGRIHTQSPAIPFALPQQQQQQQRHEAPRIKPAHSRKQQRRRDNASQVTAAMEAAPSVAALDLPPPSKFLRVNETRIARELLSAPQPYAQSLTHGRSGLGADAGLMMARSFRVAFGPQGQLVYLRGSLSSRLQDDDDDNDDASSKRGRGATSVVVIDSIARHLHAAPGCLEPLAMTGSGNVDDEMERIRQRHIDTVRAQWRHARVAPASPEHTLLVASCPPAVSFSAHTTIASVLGEMARDVEDDSSSRHQQLTESDVEEERRILELASVLFDDEPVDTAMDDGDDDDDFDIAVQQRVRSVRRRQALTKWLMSAVHDSVQRDLVRASESPSPAAAAVFALMTGHRIEAACLAATSHRDYRLAMLVAQSGAGAVGGGGNDPSMQALIRTQLARLDDDGGMAFAPAYRRVYELIGGRVPYASSVVDWKRAFALGMWYAQSPAGRIADAVSIYEHALAAQPSAHLAPPLPAWLFAGGDDGAASNRLSTLPLPDISAALSSSSSVSARRAATRALDLHRRGVWDPVFQLLKLFSEPAYPLERALLSESFSAARGDSRLSALLAWLFATVRQSRGFEDAKPQSSGSAAVVDSLAYDRLLTSWALQLESLGLWHWACFVMLQLSSSSAHKAHAIRALLDRSMPTSLPTAALPPASGPAADLLPLCATNQSLSFAVDDSIEEQLRFVLDDLHLPRQWLYDAMATRSRYDRDWIDVRCNGAAGNAAAAGSMGGNFHSLDQQHPVLAAAQRQFTASGRPIVRSYFGQYAPSQQQQQQQVPTESTSLSSSSTAMALAGNMPTDTRAAATLRHVVWLLSARQLSTAHTVVLQRVAPDAILRGDYHLLARVLSHLDPMPSMSSAAAESSSEGAAVVPYDEWATGGQVYQAFLGAIDGLPSVLQPIASATESSFELMREVQRIYHAMRALLAALPSLAARFDAPGALGFYDGFGAEACWYSPEESRVLRIKYSVAVSDMASVISDFVQQLERHAPIASLQALPPPGSIVGDFLAPPCNRADSVALPLSQDVRILRTLQMARTCFDSLVGSELEA